VLTLLTPWTLVLLLFLPLFPWVSRARRAALGPRRGRLALSLRLLIYALVVLALTGPERTMAGTSVSTVFLVDASASVGTAGERASIDWATRAVKAAGPRDEAGLVLFGAAPALAVPLAHYDALPDPVAPASRATDLEAALRLGLGLLPDGSPGRLVLLSDGQATQGDANAAAAQAVARGITVDAVAVGQPATQDVQVVSVDLPGQMRLGQDAPLRFTLHSTRATTATLSVTVDGAPATEQIALPAGSTVLRSNERFTTRGPHTVSVEVSTPGDRLPGNDRLGAATLVSAPGRVLLVVRSAADAARAAALATTLARAQLTVTPILAANLPSTTAGYAAVDAVVLDDVEATTLSGKAQNALAAAVHDDGLGLVVVGGAHSFGEGGYPHSTLEQTLPLTSATRPRKGQSPPAIVLVIDKSGSMADSVAGVAKATMVKVAANGALDHLDEGTMLGVLAFDDATHTVVPFHAVGGAADHAAMRRDIDALSPGGDTFIYPALQQAEQLVTHVATTQRHIVLLTDGQGEQDQPFDNLIRRMRREHVTVSTIGVGQDVVQDELGRWAGEGGGTFHYVADPRQIPRIVLAETRGVGASTTIRSPHLQPTVDAPSPLLSPLDGQTLPRLTAYDAALARPEATVALRTPSGDPLLASWQDGLGRVAAWTSSTDAAWSGPWNPVALPAFWTSLASWALRAPAADPAAPALTLDHGFLAVTLSATTPSGGFDDGAAPRVRVTDPSGGVQVVDLALDGPGLYRARLPLAGPGVYAAAHVTNTDRGGATAVQTVFAVPYDKEYEASGVDGAALAHLADVTGGRLLTSPADAFRHDGLGAAVTWQPLWPLLLWCALLLFPLDVALRLLTRTASTYRPPTSGST